MKKDTLASRLSPGCVAAAFQPQSNPFGSNTETGFFLGKWNMIMWELTIAEKIEYIE